MTQRMWVWVHMFLVRWMGSVIMESYNEQACASVQLDGTPWPQWNAKLVKFGGADMLRRGWVRMLRGADVQPTPLKFYTGMPTLSFHRCHLRNFYTSTLNFPQNVLGTCLHHHPLLPCWAELTRRFSQHSTVLIFHSASWNMHASWSSGTLVHPSPECSGFCSQSYFTQLGDSQNIFPGVSGLPWRPSLPLSSSRLIPDGVPSFGSDNRTWCTFMWLHADWSLIPKLLGSATQSGRSTEQRLPAATCKLWQPQQDGHLLELCLQLELCYNCLAHYCFTSSTDPMCLQLAIPGNILTPLAPDYKNCAHLQIRSGYAFSLSFIVALPLVRHSTIRMRLPVRYNRSIGGDLQYRHEHCTVHAPKLACLHLICLLEHPCLPVVVDVMDPRVLGAHKWRHLPKPVGVQEQHNLFD